MSAINPFIIEEFWNLPLALSLRFNVDKGLPQAVFGVSEKGSYIRILMTEN